MTSTSTAQEAGVSVQSTEKQCRDCCEVKATDEFYVYKTGRLYPRCKACHYIYTQNHRYKYRDRINELARARYRNGHNLRKRAEKRLRKYGLTEEGYDAILEYQGGVCAVCRLPFVESIGNVGNWDIACVDHDHATGEVRGILHRRCNLVIEFLPTHEDVDRALEYLKGDPR